VAGLTALVLLVRGDTRAERVDVGRSEASGERATARSSPVEAQR